MNVYIDQNFLINCMDKEGWRANAVRASQSGSVQFVLSPWSIYEIGNASHIEDLLDIVEEFAPSWILERVDLQLREFVVAWNNLWNGKAVRFSPIRTFPEVQASFLRCPLASAQRFSIRDHARMWRGNDAAGEAEVQFRRVESISGLNRIMYREGKLTPTTIREIRKRYVARQFVIAQRVGMPYQELYEYENLILREKRLETFISFFVDFGGMSEMLSHRVEEALTFNQWKTEAKLNPNRQVDRIHAIVALPYCDLFVTSDRELIKKTQAIRGGLSFEIADVISGEEFISRLEAGFV